MGELGPEATAAIYGGAVGGILGVVGALLGVVVERLLRAWGSTQCKITGWDFSARATPRDFEAPEEHKFYLRELSEEFLSNKHLHFRFTLRAFNTRDVPTAWADPRLTFLAGRKVLMEIPLRDEESKKMRAGVDVKETVGILNLPPKELVEVNAVGWPMYDERDKLVGCDRIEFRAEYPSSKLFPRRFRQRVEHDRIIPGVSSVG